MTGRPARTGSAGGDGSSPRGGTRLQIFAKEPLPGQVKSRLSPPLSTEEAAEVYRQLVWRALEVAARARERGVIDSIECWASPRPASPFFSEVAKRFACTLREQTGRDLGERMRSALHAALAEGARPLLIGSDCPELSVTALADAAAALDANDAVFVPATDGGYVLVGLARPIECFDGIAWSTASVMAQTRARLRERGAVWRELSALADIDTVDDLRRWREREAAARVRKASAIALLAAIALGGLLAAGTAIAQVATVLNSAENSLSLVDMGTYAEIKRIPVGKEPHHLMATPDDKFLVVANAMSNDLLFFDPRTGERKQQVTKVSDPYQIGFSPDRRWFVSNSLRLDRVDLYDASDFRLLERIAAPRTPSHLAFSPDSALVFVTLQGSNELLAIDLGTRKPAWKMPIGRVPAGVIMTPDGKHLLVGVMEDDAVEVIDWRERKSVKKVKTGKGAHNFLVRGDGRQVFVSNRVEGSISILDLATLSVIETFPVPGGPDCMDITKDGKELWVTSRFAHKVHVIDLATRKIIHAIPVGRSPHGVYVPNSAPRG